MDRLASFLDENMERYLEYILPPPELNIIKRDCLVWEDGFVGNGLVPDSGDQLVPYSSVLSLVTESTSFGSIWLSRCLYFGFTTPKNEAQHLRKAIQIDRVRSMVLIPFSHPSSTTFLNVAASQIGNHCWCCLNVPQGFATRCCCP